MMNEGPVVGAMWQGEYLLQAALGDPANGVFRAQRRRDSQPVALRIWRAPNDPLAREFLEHANAACAVRHAAIAQVDAAGREEHYCYVVSEYIVGQKLDTWADQVGIPPLGEVIELMRRLCEGLALAARGGVTHSALHPRNLVMVQGDPTSSRRALPKLLDLGVPQLARPRQPHSLAAQFMAPEHLAVVLEPSQPPLPHATSVMNVYSCGALLYYLCTGGPPHRQTEPGPLRDAQLHGKLVVPSRINPQITPSLNAVMMQALAIDPQVRYSTVSDLADALTHVSLTPSVAGARPVLSSLPPRERIGSQPSILIGPTRANAVGRDRVMSPPPAISVPPGIARRPPAAATFEEEHETARTGAMRIPSKRPAGAWVAPPEPAGSTAPPPPLHDSVPAGSFSSIPPARPTPVPRLPQSVLASPLALFSGAPHEQSEVSPIHLEPASDPLVTNDTETARPPRDRQRNPMMWFGVLAALACAALFGLVRLLGNPSSSPSEQTPTVTVDRPLIESSTRAAQDVPRVAPIEPAPTREPIAPPPAAPNDLPPIEREPLSARPSTRGPTRSNSRGPATGASPSNREPRAPSITSQSATAAREASTETESPPSHVSEPANVAPSAVPAEPIAQSPEPAQQASKAAPRGPDAATSNGAASAAREETKPEKPDQANQPLEARSAIGEVTIRGSMPTSSVRRAVERINPQLAACYARAAQAAGKNQFGSVTVELEIDERGRARSPAARGAKLSGLNECVAEAASKVISDRAPDTGTIHASFKVIFSQ
jgi:serine/threonine protein kinase